MDDDRKRVERAFGVPSEKLSDGDVSELAAYLDAREPRRLADDETRADGETSRAYRERTAKDDSERAEIARYFGLAARVTEISDRALGIERAADFSPYGEEEDDEAVYVPTEIDRAARIAESDLEELFRRFKETLGVTTAEAIERFYVFRGRSESDEALVRRLRAERD